MFSKFRADDINYLEKNYTFAFENKKSMEKQLYIIGGCNGAGKTTASYTILPDILNCKNFVNADEIARGLSPFAPEQAAIEAERMMLSNISLLLEENKTFSIETTLTTRSYVNLILRAQSQGYKVNLLYFWLDSPDLAIKRVAQRVSEGGHNIPDETIRRRYHAGINNLFKLFIPIVDSWYVLDNSDSRDAKVVIVAKGEKNGKKEIKDISVYNKIKSYVR